MPHTTSTYGAPRTCHTGLFSFLPRAFSLAAQRNRLSHMDSAQLRDLGLTRSEANAEARRPFWDVPAGWKC